jgi:hypothetical protein
MLKARIALANSVLEGIVTTPVSGVAAEGWLFSLRPQATANPNVCIAAPDLVEVTSEEPVDLYRNILI